ncbi:MAG TPA: transporter substrate-binding domain-containing protein [Gaiellaceae bacterium]|jgi:polar amino acid transport system substrate-binding protein
MKRLALMLALAGAAVAGVFATGGAAASHGSAAKLPKLPALPATVASRHRWEIGVKCDFSPFGYIDAQGNHAGYDVEVAQRFATLAFGRPNRISMTCVNTASRIPTLMSGRVDAIVSTLTWTPARADQIDFSIPYYSATGRLLVPNDSSITKLSDIAGKTVVTTRGAIYDTWMHNCFRSTKVLEVDGTADAVLAVKQGRADAFMFDDALLLGVATQDPTLKLTNDKFLNVPWGIGVRKGDAATLSWINAAIQRMRAKDEFTKILEHNAPKRFAPSFLDNVPRPGNAFSYPVGKDPTTVCPT